MSSAHPSDQTLPDSYLKQVKEALKHLYDFPFLQKSPLAKALAAGGERSLEEGARKLRQDLLAAIETLNPQTDSAAQTPQARVHSLLVLHYVEGWSVQESAHELSISTRQAHRNLRDGENSVAAILWAGCQTSEATQTPQPRAVHLSSVQAEMSRIVPVSQPVDLIPILHRAYQAVERQAVQRTIDVRLDVPDRPIIVATDGVLAQQIFINLFSHCIRQATEGGPVQVVVKTADDRVKVCVEYTAASAWTDKPALDDVLQQLVEHVGWEAQENGRERARRSIALDIANHRPLILVIDDNEGLVRLLHSYLTDHACQVKSADNGRDGLQLASELNPDAILLDVMLPQMDGWEVLQRLRNQPQTEKTPVIMCSVLKSPELAYSLGATLYLPKPIGREDILSALHELSIV